jgi:hypothetical protein
LFSPGEYPPSFAPDIADHRPQHQKNDCHVTHVSKPCEWHKNGADAAPNAHDEDQGNDETHETPQVSSPLPLPAH